MNNGKNCKNNPYDEPYYPKWRFKLENEIASSCDLVVMENCVIIPEIWLLTWNIGYKDRLWIEYFESIIRTYKLGRAIYIHGHRDQLLVEQHYAIAKYKDLLFRRIETDSSMVNLIKQKLHLVQQTKDSGMED